MSLRARSSRVLRWVVVFCLLARVASAQCAEDDALSDAAATLLLNGERSDEAIARALREAGSDLPHVRLRTCAYQRSSQPPSEVTSSESACLRTSRDGTGVPAWLSGVQSDAPLVCGRAQSEGRVLVLAGARGGALVPEARNRFRVQLAEGFSQPRLAFSDAEGHMTRSRVEVGEIFTIPEELARPVQVQLVATGSSGPRPIAVRYIGGDHSSDLPAVVIDGEGDLDQRLRALRVAYQVSDLRDNRLLVREASRHAQNVCRAQQAAHVLHPQRDPQARLISRGIQARVVGEVVARARTEEAAFAAMSRSASHRMALVDRRFTDVGIGRAERRGRVCVVVTLAAWPRYVGH